MSKKRITVKMDEESLEALRLIVELTGEKQYRALARLIRAELKRLQREQPQEKEP